MEYVNCMKWGDNLLVRGVENGKRVKQKIAFEPELFLPTTAKGQYKTLDGVNLKKITGMSMKRAAEFIRGNVQNSVYGMNRFEYQWTRDCLLHQDQNVMIIDIETECENGFPDPAEAAEEINLITIKQRDAWYTIGTMKHGVIPEKSDRPNHTIYNCNGEDELIETFLKVMKRCNPDIVTGWNVNLFDLPYLYKRIERRQGSKVAKSMSPWEVVQSRQVMVNGKQQTSYVFYGFCILDYFDLYQKYTYQMQPSYKLDYIASVELGRKKLSYKEHDSIHSFYKKDWKKFVEYNIIDVDIIVELDEKLGFIDLALQTAYDASANPHDVFSQVRIWDLLIYNYLVDEMSVQPSARVDPPKVSPDQYAGAFVKEPVPGIYDWVVTFDVASMYPNAIRFLNISPETVVDDCDSVCPALKYIRENSPEENIKLLISNDGVANNVAKNAADANVCASPTGDLFRKDVSGFLPHMMEKMFRKRKATKKSGDDYARLAELQGAELRLREHGKPRQTNMTLDDDELREAIRENKEIAKKLHLKQMALKISLNSCYGSLGNQYSRYYDLRLATSITLMGQLSIRFIADRLNRKLNGMMGTDNIDYVAYIDTDSVHLKLDTLVDAKCAGQTEDQKIVFLQKCGKAINDYIGVAFDELGKVVNMNEPSFAMECEAISRKALWTGKKRYVLNVIGDPDRVYPVPKNKIMGLEIKRSSTPDYVKPMLERSIELILEDDIDKFREYINTCRKDFMKQPPAEIAFPRGVSSITKYLTPSGGYSKGTPIAVKAAILYNRLVQEKRLDTKYSLLTDGSKIKFIYLKPQNPLRETVIGFTNDLPEEFELDTYIDADLQFQKTFIDPIESILKHIGWEIVETPTLF